MGLSVPVWPCGSQQCPRVTVAVRMPMVLCFRWEGGSILGTKTLDRPSKAACALLLPMQPVRYYCQGCLCAATAKAACALLLPMQPVHCYCQGCLCAATAKAACALLLPRLPVRCYCQGCLCAATAKATYGQHGGLWVTGCKSAPSWLGF